MIKKSLLAGLIVASTLPAASAFADQCAWITQQQAKSAADQVKVGDTVQKLCEPCDEKTMQALPVKSVKVEHVKGDYYQLVLSGEPVDLAYVFVEATDGISGYRNLADLARCETTGVSRRLDPTGKPR